MSNVFVYLAGPIAGCNGVEAHDWRVYVAAKLAEYSITAISPLRCEPLIGERYGHGYPADRRFGTPSAIGAKNKMDVRRADLVFAYLPLRERKSIGTIWELGGAEFLNKPVVVVTDDPELRTHPAILVSPWVLDDLDDGIDTTIGVLGGYCGGKNV